MAAEKPRKRRLKRPDDEVQEDIRRYQELLRRESELERDIPPRRTGRSLGRKKGPKGTKSVAKRSTMVKKEEEELELTPEKKPKSAFLLVKPQFKYSKPREATTKRPQYKHSGGILLVTDKKNIQSFSTKVLVENSYQDLIKMIRNNMGSKECGGNLDIGMKWNLMAKNIDYETDRFLIDCNQEKEFIMKETEPVFSYGDVIDSFFQTIKEDLQEYHPRNVPLV